MAARKTSGGNTTELEVLKALWDHGPGTVRQIHAQLRADGCKAAYTTILTHLQRLEAKGYVVSDKRDVAHVFRAAVSRDRLLRRRLKDLANELCDGTAAPLLHALVEGRRFKPEEIERFRRLLDELEDEKRK
ncbi:MAG TPA: BlaI/MecI/CopY family transcriptional regulator [Gemmataceae bacterium]